METIWHGDKSLAYRLGAECFGSPKWSSIECLNEKNYNSLCMDLRKSNASKHPDFTQNHTTIYCSFSCHPKCILTLLQHSQQTCNALFSSWISAKEKAINALDQLMKLLKTSPDVSENYWCMHVSLDFLHSQEVVYGLGEFGSKANIFHHPSLGFRLG